MCLRNTSHTSKLYRNTQTIYIRALHQPHWMPHTMGTATIARNTGHTVRRGFQCSSGSHLLDPRLNILPKEHGTGWIRRARCKASSANGRHISHSTQQYLNPSVNRKPTPKLNFGSLHSVSHIDSTSPCGKATTSHAASECTCRHSTHSFFQAVSRPTFRQNSSTYGRLNKNL